MHRSNLRSATSRLLPALLLTAALLPAEALRAQPLQPGEAYVTRFSGTVSAGDKGELIVIDPDGPVGSIIDLRAPGQPPQGQHWVDEPQRQPLKASEVGQIFGVALDGENPPNIYVTATPAFGLHRTPDNAQWMPGMWGPGGPGAVYRIDSKTGRPTVFAQIGLGKRPNTGASLGNIAYDRWNRQFFVSDLETGMIHRLRATDGADLGIWDHGTQARLNFFDPENKQPAKLPPIPFDPSSRAQIEDCGSGPFSTAPECWNLAASGRRVWGLGVSRDAKRGQVRLYYAVTSSPDYGNAAWEQLPEDEKRNSVWSVLLAPDGGFTGDVRREFVLPDFFETAEDISRAGYSHPVSDITFPTCGNRGIMLVAERGGIRNLGLGEQNPFAQPHEARLLRYELDHEGTWRPIGRYDVGFRERQPEEGPPAMQANCAGGAAFGYGYEPISWRTAPNQPDQFVWTSGDALCSSLGPCNAPGIGDPAGTPGQPGAGAPGGPGPTGAPPQQASETGEGVEQAGDIEVHGIQGIAEGAFQPLRPPGAVAGTTGQKAPPPGRKGPPQKGPAPPPQGQGSSLNEAYMIDTDINVDPTGKAPDTEDTLSNDATMIGDLVIYQICETPPLGFAPSAPPPAMAAGFGHDPQVSHSTYESHGRASSHFRHGSHSPYVSHNRYQSHYRYWSHYREGSHNRWWTHERRGSIHNRYATHLRHGSEHNRQLTHQRYGTPHNRLLTHKRFGTPHDRRLTHERHGTPHDRLLTHKRRGTPHDRRMTHERTGTPHNRALTHQRTGTPHNRALSHERVGTPHQREASHQRVGSPHARLPSHKVSGSRVDDIPKKQHTRALSNVQTTTPAPVVSPVDQGHTPARSHARTASPGHTPARSHARTASPVHTPARSHARTASPVHTQARSHARAASPAKQHSTRLSHVRMGSPAQHNPQLSHSRLGSTKKSAPPVHNVQQSHRRIGSATGGHNPKLSHLRTGSPGAQKGGGGAHTRAASHQRQGSRGRP